MSISTLAPTPRRWIQLVRKDTHGNGDGDAFDAEEGKLVLPVEARTGNCGIRLFGVSSGRRFERTALFGLQRSRKCLEK
jgi:hypothetical protein